ncbi:hypothetical protein F5X68DRAFT_129537 [Plectosphaerella plurivora]|uniref:Homeobox protein 4 n=1 Tax=Plectosphaerella plurivora TaxID=936078 RepID=A0A9P8VHX1_9PEZI|nr:hypothetical protein F5X68DRAFT_129537 [Plectosphaerella plurivora]
MDEFVNWDNATESIDALGAVPPPHASTMPSDPDIDLVLANVDDDDFSFWALQHFNGDQTQQQQQPGLSDDFFVGLSQPGLDANQQLVEPADFCNQFVWITPQKPCVNCSLGRFSCKTIQEGQFKGYCTSCVALRCECSFGFASPSTAGQGQQAMDAFPHWSTTVDEHPNIISNDHSDPVSLLSASLSESSQQMQPVMSSSVEMGPPTHGLNKNSPPAKIGARFSRESVKILKNWLSSHSRHPYPSEEEKEMLQRQTGLNKTQISNWLANARRRGKIQPNRSTSPHVRNTWTGPIDIPRRPGTPAFDSNRNLNPLERWVDSPPENEPASVTAIARAVASNSDMSSGLNSPYSFAFTDDGSGRSLCNVSSASSAGTSSGGSFASAYSHNSFGSFGSMTQERGRRRRRRRAAPKREEKTSLTPPLKTFQCTFCTETFRTKHDWQRHEKSLHLSLERWVCAPDGPRVLNPQTNQVCCVFCGEPNPDDAHIESHNHSACLERSLEERTFYRKDHLNQHLRLVHDVKFLDWCMKTWKVASPEIRSRCGFCGIVMDNWSIRVDHLAEHFKTGNTMADWKGDWGFDAPVLDMLENSIPPYLIDNERHSPFPYIASGAPAETPRSAYELIKLELAYFMINHQEKTGTLPDDEQMRLEACRIIFASEVLSLQGINSKFSWLRDVIMGSDDLARQARSGPMRQGIENRLAILKINGKDNLFEQCPLEKQLQEYVSMKILLGLTAMDDELQQEACCIIGRIEEASTTASDFIANWLLRLVTSSTSWLANFRQRAHLPRTEDIMDINSRHTDPNVIDSTIHNYNRLDRSLGQYLAEQRAIGIEPTDNDLQAQARVIIYGNVFDEFDDGWNQTAADNVEWLDAFKTRHAAAPAELPATFTCVAPRTTGHETQLQQLEASYLHGPSGQSGKQGVFFVSDANCYRRLAHELGRYVSSTMSPNNPNRHVPTDAEIQHQARWILYDDDDPWNQTAADNAEWLLRFKRDNGILPPGPGLRVTNATPAAGASTAPTNPTTASPNSPGSDKVEIVVHRNAKPFETNQAAVDRYIETFAARYQRPAAVFCSRELERGLASYVRADIAAGKGFPSDDAIRARARTILGSAETAADDSALLGKFKIWVMSQLAHPEGEEQTGIAPTPSALPCDLNMNLTDAEMDSILADMSFDITADTNVPTPGRMA